MKLKLTLSTITLAIVAMFQVYILSKIPQSTAVGSFNRVRHCSPLSCGAKRFWDDGWNVATYRPYRRSSIFDHFNQMFYLLQDDYERELSKLTDARSMSGPRYEMKEDETQIELLLEVPGIQALDIKIQLEQGGKLLRVNGTRKIQHQGAERTSTFEKMFTIDPKAVDIKEIKANMEDGILSISVPKLPKEVKDANRMIPIPISFKDKELTKNDDVVLVTKEQEQVEVDNKGENDDDLEITEEDI